MVIEAARSALNDLSLDRLVDTVKKMIPISHMIQTVDTLKYLYMGGRMGKAQELLGRVPNIKPLVGIEDGVIVPLGCAHSRGQAYQKMADMVAEFSPALAVHTGLGMAGLCYYPVEA